MGMRGSSGEKVSSFGQAITRCGLGRDVETGVWVRRSVAACRAKQYLPIVNARCVPK